MDDPGPSLQRDGSIAVRENHNLMKNDLEKLGFEKGKYFVAENYPEAVGIMTAVKAGACKLITVYR